MVCHVSVCCIRCRPGFETDPGRPAALNDVLSWPPVATAGGGGRTHYPKVLERLEVLAQESPSALGGPNTCLPANPSCSRVHVEVAAERRELRLRCSGPCRSVVRKRRLSSRAGPALRHPTARRESSGAAARRSLKGSAPLPSSRRQPTALSVAPVAACNESRCPPSIIDFIWPRPRRESRRWR